MRKLQTNPKPLTSLFRVQYFSRLNSFECDFCRAWIMTRQMFPRGRDRSPGGRTVLQAIRLQLTVPLGASKSDTKEDWAGSSILTRMYRGLQPRSRTFSFRLLSSTLSLDFVREHRHYSLMALLSVELFRILPANQTLFSTQLLIDHLLIRRHKLMFLIEERAQQLPERLKVIAWCNSSLSGLLHRRELPSIAHQ